MIQGRILSEKKIGMSSRSLRNDNRISRQYNLHFQNFIVVAFPTKKKTVFWTIFLSAPNSPPPPSKTANFIFIVVSPSLTIPQTIEARYMCAASGQN